MSDAIGDEDAIQFSSAFYEALGYGRDVETAFELGLIGVGLAGLTDDEVRRLIVRNWVNPRELHFGG